MAPPEHNLLIVSDLHLGGVLRPPFGFRTLRQVARVDRDLSRFLAYHARTPRRGPGGQPLPWTLILNGDTIDFLHMDVRPPEGAALHFDADDEEYGLAFEEARSRWKLDILARYHRRAFRALSDFIAAGNRCVFIVGNHDADIWFRAVREGLVSHLAAYAEDPEALAERVCFAPWFHFEEGRAWVEHGHRFDPYATFPDPLVPVRAGRPGRLAPNFGHFGLRYFCNKVPSFPIHDVETWGMMDYLRWAAAKPFRRLLAILWQYVIFMARYLRAVVWDRVMRWRSMAHRLRARAVRLRGFARRNGMPLRRIRALDRLRLQPVGAGIFRFLQALYFDRFALIGAVALGTIYMASAWPAGWAALGAAALVSGAGWLWRWLDRRRPRSDVHPILARMARRIGFLTGAPVVVFGHTHHPILRRIGRTYFLNPGSWEHVPRRRMHKADEVCDCGARFGVIVGHRGETRPELMRWCRRMQAPRRASAT